MVISPNKKEYDAMIKQLTSPAKEWMGPGKEHIGFYDMELNKDKSISGRKFVDSSYCYPEQSYLTKRFSGKWTYIEYSFQSWSLDPCNSFGIHMAAFNPKPWFKQPANSKIKGVPGYNPYFDPDIFVSDIPKAVVPENENLVLENISISYELFNDLIIWGLVNYSKLVDFFLEDTKIYGTKISFGEDKFKPLSGAAEYKLIRDIPKKDPDYKKLSVSQQYISNLLNDYKYFVAKVKDKYLSICHTKTKDRYGEYLFDRTIITYPDHIDKSLSEKTQLLEHNKIHIGRLKGTPIGDLTEDEAKYYAGTREFHLNKEFRAIFLTSKYSYLVKSDNHYATLKKKKATKRKGKSKGIKTNRKGIQLLYFKKNGCKWCKEFEDKLWQEVKNGIKTRVINGPKNPHLAKEYGIKTYPALVRIKSGKHKLFKGKRTFDNIMKFLKN